MEEEALLREPGAMTCCHPPGAGHQVSTHRALLVQKDAARAQSSSSSKSSSLLRCPAVTFLLLICSEGILLPSLVHIPTQMRSSFMCPAHPIHLWIRPCLLSCVTSIERGPRKPSQSTKTTRVKVKLGAPSFFSVPLPAGEQVSPGPAAAEAQASPANSLQAPGGVGIEVAVEGSKPAGEKAK